MAKSESEQLGILEQYSIWRKAEHIGSKYAEDIVETMDWWRLFWLLFRINQDSPTFLKYLPEVYINLMSLRCGFNSHN